jgi:hypothetical protein
MTIMTDSPSGRGNVWAAIWHARFPLADVAVPSNLSDDPSEWAAAQKVALDNASRCAGQARRWIEVAQDIDAHRETMVRPRLAENRVPLPNVDDL